jgi:hypothetical protein
MVVGIKCCAATVLKFNHSIRLEIAIVRDFGILNLRNLPMSKATNQRTQWAERHMEEILSLPFISEFVFRSPQIIDTTQKEVADLMVLHKGFGILFSQKLQEDPLSRSEERNELWVRKKAKAAASQLIGAIRSAREKPIWCDHPRRGRVDFPDGLPPIRHGIVLVETWVPVDLQREDADLPLAYGGVPFTYMSVNDFVNLAFQLRTVPEVLAYLDARRTLPLSSLRIVGDESCLFEMYLLEGGSLAGCIGHYDAKLLVTTRNSQLLGLLQQKAEHDYHNSFIERVADCLATRMPNCIESSPPELVAAFDPPENRTSYMVMQEVIADLRLRERAELGRGLITTVQALTTEQKGLKIVAAHFDSRDWVWVLAASKNWDRSDVLRHMFPLMRGAMAFYEKSNGMVIVDRDGINFEVCLSRPGLEPSEHERVFGQKTFGRLRMSSTPLTLI